MIIMKISTWDWHKERGAVFGDYFGCEVPLSYGDPLEEYHALQNGAGLRDVSFLGKIRATGKDRNRFLNGMLSNDIKTLESGKGVWALSLDIKGRIQADMKVYGFPDHLLLVLQHYARESIMSGLDRYIISEDVRLADVTNDLGMIQVIGPKAELALRESGLTQFPEDTLSFLTVSMSGVECQLIRLSVGYAILFPSVQAGTVLESVPAPLIGSEAFEVFRVEKGLPLLKKDMDENNLPQEARLDAALNFQKGCYLGQEVMARIDAQGHVNRHLMGIASSEDLTAGDRIYVGEKEVGWITSVVKSPLLSQNLALGYVRREQAKEGEEVQIGEQKVSGSVKNLPITG